MHQGAIFIQSRLGNPHVTRIKSAQYRLNFGEADEALRELERLLKEMWNHWLVLKARVAAIGMLREGRYLRNAGPPPVDNAAASAEAEPVQTDPLSTAGSTSPGHQADPLSTTGAQGGVSLCVAHDRVILAKVEAGLTAQRIFQDLKSKRRSRVSMNRSNAM